MRKPKSLKEMRKYLKEHFRYYTANSWNRSSSYAANVKLRNIMNGVSRELQDRAYEFLDVEAAFWDINDLIREFAERHEYMWQIAFNGRSSGYMVLYSGGKKKTDYKTRCDECGKLTWYDKEQKCHMDNCDGTLKLLKEPVYEVFTMPGKGIDNDVDFDEMEPCCVKERVDVVWDFDQTVEKCRKAFINFVKSHKVQEEEIMVPKKYRVAVAA